MKKVLLCLWQLPQNIVGLVLTPFYKVQKIVPYKDVNVRICPDFPGGISLGEYVFVRHIPEDTSTWNDVKHEYGHTIQSKYLGPLYLLVIGIPSILWASLYKYYPENPNKYYTFFTERWADKLGGVVR